MGTILLIGISAGIISGLMGVGGGAIIIPSLVLLYNLPQQLAQGISLAVIVPTAMIGAYAYGRKGNIDVKLALLAILGAIFGAIIGATIAQSIPGPILRKLFGGFAIFLSIKLLLRR